MVFLSLTSSLVFALPADAGEKMGLSITVLLAYAVYLTLITDAMPNTSMQVSIVIEGEGVSGGELACQVPVTVGDSGLRRCVLRYTCDVSLSLC